MKILFCLLRDLVLHATQGRIPFPRIHRGYRYSLDITEMFRKKLFLPFCTAQKIECELFVSLDQEHDRFCDHLPFFNKKVVNLTNWSIQLFD